MTLQISYVDDQTPNSFRTYANYKKVVVSLTRAQDSKLLTREVTYVSAAARNAATESSITAIVQDYGTGGAVPSARPLRPVVGQAYVRFRPRTNRHRRRDRCRPPKRRAFPGRGPDGRP